MNTRFGRTAVLGIAVTAVAGCGGGGTDRAATLDCRGSTCTVAYPAKARNNQSSSGGPPAEVLGVQTQLFSISGGQALFRIADQSVTLEPNKKQKVGPFTVEAVDLTDTSAVVRYTKH